MILTGIPGQRQLFSPPLSGAPLLVDCLSAKSATKHLLEVGNQPQPGRPPGADVVQQA
jgi:hypothetical protein